MNMEYELIRSDRKSLGAQIKDGRVIVRAPRRMPVVEIEAFLLKHRRWIAKHLAQAQARADMLSRVSKLTSEGVIALREKAKGIIPQRVAYYAPLVGVSYERVTVRLQSSRWGSCSAKGTLSFNCLLTLAPPEVLDAIVVHELCHRKVMDHSHRFYAEIYRVMPDYKERHQWLKENGELLLSLVKGLR